MRKSRKARPHHSDHHSPTSILRAATAIPVFHIERHFRFRYLYGVLQFKITCVWIIPAHLLSSITPAGCSGGEYHPHLTMEGKGLETRASQTWPFIPIAWDSWEAADLHSVAPRWGSRPCFFFSKFYLKYSQLQLTFNIMLVSSIVVWHLYNLWSDPLWST